MLPEPAHSLALDLVANDGERTESALDRLENDSESYRLLEPLLVLYNMPFNSRDRLDRSEIAQFLELFMEADDLAVRKQQLALYDFIDTNFDDQGYLRDAPYEDLEALAREFLANGHAYFKDVMDYHPDYRRWSGWVYDSFQPFETPYADFYQYGMIGYSVGTASRHWLLEMMAEGERLVRDCNRMDYVEVYVAYARKAMELVGPLPKAEILTFLGSSGVRINGDRQAEAAYYREALSHHPDYPDAQNNLAYNLLLTGGDLQEALTLVQSALTYADKKSYRQTHGAIHEALGNFGKAKEVYEAALADLGPYKATAESLAALLEAHPELKS